MNIRDIKYLVAVAELSSFSRAAEQCHVSQPTLSGQIKKIEKSLNITIFERSNKHVLITDPGKAIIDSSRRILAEMEQIKAIASHACNPFSGTFRLGAFPTLAPYLFPQLIPKLTKIMPELRFILVEEKTETLIKQLNCGKIDAALLALPVHNDKLSVHTLFKDNFYLAVPASNTLAKHAYIDVEELTKHPLLLLDEGHCLRDQALDICHLHHIREEHDFRATSLETLRQMIKVGTGISLFPEKAIQPDEQDIAYIPFKSPSLYRTIGILWRKTSARIAIIDKICEQFQ